MAKFITEEARQAVVDGVKRDRDSGMGIEEACRNNNISSPSYYYILKRMGLTKDRPQSPTQNLAFEFMPESEVGDLAKRVGPKSRFHEFQMALIEALKTVPEGQVPVIRAPRGATIKELHAIRTSTLNALKKRKLNWGMNYSEERGIFVVYRKEKKNGIA